MMDLSYRLDRYQNDVQPGTETGKHRSTRKKTHFDRNSFSRFTYFFGKSEYFCKRWANSDSIVKAVNTKDVMFFAAFFIFTVANHFMNPCLMFWIIVDSFFSEQ